LYSFLEISSCSPSSAVKKVEKKETPEIKKSTITISKQIRVLIGNSLYEKQIVFPEPLEIRFGEEGFASASAKEKINFKIDGQKIDLSIGNRNYIYKYFDLIPKSGKYLNYNKHSYAGKFRLAVYGFQPGLVNITDMDDYVKSVVTAEMGNLVARKNIEAVKALIICVRNYALARINEGKEIYDVFDDRRDQLYNGVVKDNSLLNDCLDETEDKVLEYDGEIANTFYFSSCGGYTENSKNVFPNAAAKYLEGVKDGEGPYCKISPSFNWEETFSEKQIINLLFSSGYIGNNDWDLQDISIESRFQSDRVNELSILIKNKLEDSKRIILKGNSIRSVLKINKGKDLLKSTMFDVALQRKNGEITQVKIAGKGNGHGVGMCQWGAVGQARAGKNYKDILEFYYPGTKLEVVND
jgi:stage II sporulation protein D